MNDYDFVNEVRNSSYIYDGFEKDYLNFKKYQQLSIDTLCAFHSVCEKNGITYQLAFGSLLGIIRDNGQIPWDYDIDVIVPSDERIKLLDSLNSDLGKDYDYFAIEHNKDCEHVIIRLAPKGYDTHYLHVDVFFVSGLPGNDCEAQILKKRIYNLTLLYKAKKYNFFKQRSDSKKEMIRMLYFKIKGIFKSVNEIWTEYLSVATAYSPSQTEFCCLADRFAIDYTNIPTSTLYNTTTIHMYNREFRIPVDYDAVLKMFYGDYMQVPPLSKRLEEFKRFYSNLSKNCRID